jgi:hypothetical protein
MDKIILYQFPFYSDSIPEELKLGRCWVVCTEDKVPMVARSRGTMPASSTNPDTWRTYEEAIDAFKTGRYAGVGRVIEEDSDYVGVDIDGCRDPLSGRITPATWEMLERLDSFSEVSPSGTGVKVWIKADLRIAHIKPGLEVYPRGRYFTITGQILSQFPVTVEERSAVLRAIIAEEFRKPEKKPAYNGPTGKAFALDEFLSRVGVEVLAVLADATAAAKYRITCPWLSEHSNQEDSGTCLGQYKNGALFFWCWHSHCRHRGWGDFRRKVCPNHVTLRIPSRGTLGKVVVQLV